MSKVKFVEVKKPGKATMFQTWIQVGNRQSFFREFYSEKSRDKAMEYQQWLNDLVTKNPAAFNG